MTGFGTAGFVGTGVVVGVDGSTGSRAALAWAASHARRTGAMLSAVAAWELPEEYRAESKYPAAPEIEQYVSWRLEETVARLAGDPHDRQGATSDPKVLSEVVTGRPADVLVERSKQAALVVVGRRGLGHGQALHRHLGSVSGDVVARAHCPVVVVPDESTPI